MSYQHQADFFNKEMSSALNNLPKGIEWAATVFPHNHKEMLLNMGVELPVLSDRAVEKRTSEFYAGRWCATQAIYKKNSLYLTPKINDDRSPLWPVNFVGSISHSKDKAIAVVSSSDEYIGLGVDIQDEISIGEQLDISDLILSDDEAMLCRKIKVNMAFEAFFSAKESIYKALYPSCLDMFEHKDVEIVSVNEHSSSFEIRLLRDLKVSWSKGQVFIVQYFIAQTYVLTWLSLDKF
jgi:enterobactin synthetase component D